ncbi:hypothetical protein CBR_g31166 [Chara braunii]|uniref:Uncharacterized protein n=1 Tax=Chara braunii TaxID=69332 RepID=A0A388LEH3_CHABU|nr:hypothetical protein CBR_g31166 [Chara braunii]|eukprot:GBG80709.1 hypothetical protein CBR_g31166 [Chara braunii]
MCPLCLPVRLWMPRCTWFHLGVGFLHERSPECQHETSVAVADDVFRNAVAANPAGVQEVRKFGSRGIVLAREKSRVFTQSVNDHEDAVVPEAVAGKQTGDVHSNGEAGFVWNRHQTQLAVGIAVAGLASLANFARVAISSDIGNEVGPPESLPKSCNSAIYSEMAGESRVMVLTEKMSPKTLSLQNGAQVFHMLVQTPDVHQDVVEVDEYESIQHVSELRCHGRLECGWGIRKAKTHNQPFEMPISRLKRRLVAVLLPDLELVISRFEVKIGEELGAAQPFEEVVDARERADVLDGLRVELAIIDAQPQVLVLLPDEENGSAVGRRARPNPTFLKKVVELCP